jgi:nicotinate-nucleotide--dimethylbenzimidazole phosphoribosyltransferase
MTADPRLTRPPTPPGFDASRAAERAADPEGWRYDDVALTAVHRVIAERRDIRRFRPDPVPDELVTRLLEAAHRAPSVGLMQPWRFITIRDPGTKASVRRLAQRERIRQADRFDDRARHFLDQKIEGVVEAPLGIVVCCDHGDPDAQILGRGTILETDVYSTACAIQNLWLTARAEGLGVGWVSFYRPSDICDLLGIPERVDPIAYLCVGWPDERPVRPGLEAAGWSRRMPVEDVVMAERWTGGEARGTIDRSAASAARDRLDAMVKPGGSLGALEALIERWAQVAGEPPPEHPRAVVLVFCGDHGHVHRGSSLWDADVSGQIALAAARGVSAAGVLAAEQGHELVVADVGLAGDTPEGVRDMKIARATTDIVGGPALTVEQFDAAVEVGRVLVAEADANGADCVVLGEIGIGNTTTTAALTSALTGADASVTVGRGAGMDAAGLERKRALVTQAIEAHGPAPLDPREALIRVGGFEFAALAGAILEASARGLPVVLDGYATGAAALAAVRLEPTAGEALFAGHRSAEPGHALVLEELGLEPVLDLRMRLGEASGALLALPVIAQAGVLHRRMGTFEETGIDRRDA